MRVLACSDRHHDQKWFRAGYDIRYYQNSFKRPAVGKSCFFYTLAWTYDFEEGESVFFAYCYPYTYTNLCADLDELMLDPVRA